MLNRSYTYGQAALFLLEQKKFNSCVVFLYYSVLQRMMYALAHCSIKPLPYSDQNPLNEDLYLKITNELCNRISGNSNEIKNFREYFQKLHDYRIKADYHFEDVTMEEAVDCRQLKEMLISKINRFFPINE